MAKRTEKRTGKRDPYTAEKPYYETIRQFVDLFQFGVAKGDETPVHVNPKDNPYPQGRFGGRKREVFTKKTIRNHLRGTKAFFIANSPDTNVHEIIWDCDPVDKKVECTP